MALNLRDLGFTRVISLVLVSVFAAGLVAVAVAPSSSAAEVNVPTGPILSDTSVLPAQLSGNSKSVSSPSSGLPSGILVATDGDPGFNQVDDNLGGSVLPVFRWRDATSGFHTSIALNGIAPIGATLDLANRNLMQSPVMGTGNMIWGTTASVVEIATQFNFLDTDVAVSIDHAAGDLGKAVVDSPQWLVALVLLSLVTLVWRILGARASGSSLVKEMFRTALILALMVFMVSGAMNTTAAPSSNQARGPKVEFGFLSPGWIVSSVSDAISKTAGAFSLPAESTVDLGGNGSGSPNACGAYTKALVDSYRPNGLSDADKSTALAVNSMWMLTGLQTWITSQMGDSGAAYDTYCHLLETRSSIPAQAQVAVMKIATDGNFVGPSTSGNPSDLDVSLAFNSRLLVGSTEVDTVDLASVGWAVCNDPRGKFGDGPWEAREGWADFGASEGGAGKIPRDCELWWNGDNGDADWATNTTSLRVGGDSKAVFENSSTLQGQYREDATQFLNTLHGHGSVSSGSAGTIGGYVYVFSAFIAFVAFGFASILILVAKVMLIMMMLMTFFVLLASLIPGRQSDALTSYGKKLVGMAFVAWGYSLILQLMVFVAMVLVRLSVAIWDAGSNMTIIMSGLAPVLAWASIVWLFKSIFKMPNPMSIKGGLAMAGVAGVAGGAVAGMVSNMGKTARYEANERLLGRATGGRLGSSLNDRRSSGPGGRTAPGAGGSGMGSQVPDNTGATGAPVKESRVRAAAERDEAEVTSAGDTAGAAAAAAGAGKARTALAAFRARQVSRGKLGMEMEGGTLKRAVGRRMVVNTAKAEKTPAASGQHMRSAMAMARGGQAGAAAGALGAGVRAKVGEVGAATSAGARRAASRLNNARKSPGVTAGTAARKVGGAALPAVKIAGKTVAVATVASLGPAGWVGAAAMTTKWAKGASTRAKARHENSRRTMALAPEGIAARQESLARLAREERTQRQRQEQLGANADKRNDDSQKPEIDPNQGTAF